MRRSTERLHEPEEYLLTAKLAAILRAGPNGYGQEATTRR